MIIFLINYTHIIPMITRTFLYFKSIESEGDKMIDFVIKKMNNPLSDIKVDLGTDKPLWTYVQKAIQDIEILNMMRLNPIDDESVLTSPFIHVGNWEWNPHPL